MSASLYGWHLPGLADTANLRKHVIDMLTKTHEHMQHMTHTEIRDYISDRIECLCELAYVFMLFQRADMHTAEDAILLASVRQPSHHVAEMCHQRVSPRFCLSYPSPTPPAS